VLSSWWHAAGGYQLRVAWLDSRRVPGLLLLGAVAVFWPLTDFTLLPVGVAAAACLLVMLATRRLYWISRWRVRRALLPAIGVLALVVLTAQAGPLAWGLAIGAWLIIAGCTDRIRARRRTLAWLQTSIARTTRVDPRLLRMLHSEWDGTRLTWCEIDHRGAIREEDAAVRDRIAAAASWSLRHLGRYTVAWVPGTNVFEVQADPLLPTLVDEQHWGELPGIPIGVTDLASADGMLDTIDAATGDVLTSLPIKLINPADSEKHLLVIGGTGSGKSNFTRGFIARALQMGWFPGGAFIFDGKGGSDYIPFEDRVGVHCVARDPDEWARHIPEVSAMMRARYDEEAEYHRGHSPRPSQPRYLVVLDEIQEIRSTLGKQVVDPFLQQVSRQMRGSNGRLMLVTQRPDTEDAIPGAVRDMLEERIILGFVSGTGARMVLDRDWQTVVDEYGVDPVPGRGVARIGGKLARIQSFRLDLPREHPEVEQFYPPKLTAQTPPGQTYTRPGGVPRSTVGRWAPKPPQAAPLPAAAPTDPVGNPVPDDAPTPPYGVPLPPVDPSDGSGGRRRTV
jgi:Helicase HerA, central domain